MGESIDAALIDVFRANMPNVLVCINVKGAALVYSEKQSCSGIVGSFFVFFQSPLLDLESIWTGQSLINMHVFGLWKPWENLQVCVSKSSKTGTCKYTTLIKCLIKIKNNSPTAIKPLTAKWSRLELSGTIRPKRHGISEYVFLCFMYPYVTFAQVGTRHFPLVLLEIRVSAAPRLSLKHSRHSNLAS